MISAKMVADSISPQGHRLSTLLVTMPRYILAEFNTHRMLSKNSASSRAIPFKKMVKSVEENPFIPIAWQKDHKGMQGVEYISDKKQIEYCEKQWLKAFENAQIQAQMLNQEANGVTKQLCNRLLEPFMYHTVLVSGTEWDNFFNLRCPQYQPTENIYKSKKDAIKNEEFEDVFKQNDILGWLSINKGQADIHIMAVAEAIWDATNESTPKELQPGQWHIPFGDNFDEDLLEEVANLYIISDKDRVIFGDYLEDTWDDLLVKIATARCARLSYQTLGEEPKIDYEADLKLHDILLKSGHFSPFEHCAKAMTEEEYCGYVRGRVENINEYEDGTSEGLDFSEAAGWCNNYQGFIQYRKLIENDNKQ